MRVFVRRILFETSLGDRLLAMLERVCGVAVVPVETIDEAVVSLVATT